MVLPGIDPKVLKTYIDTKLAHGYLSFIRNYQTWEQPIRLSVDEWISKL
jgi:hypothetical protein